MRLNYITVSILCMFLLFLVYSEINAAANMLCNIACPGTGPKDFINPHNINNFRGCTVIQGEIRILPTTFFGYALLVILLLQI